MKNGALAGKISGAGGGGFFLFLTKPEFKKNLINFLYQFDSYAESVSFYNKGCT